MAAVVKAKRCKAPNCRETFFPRNTTDSVCSLRCAITLARTKPEKVAKIAKQARKVERREDRERIKSLNRVCVDTQESVNLYVRARDLARGFGCISCSTGKIEDAGHFFPIGSKFRCSRFRFNTKCIHGQCRKCNGYAGGGNLHGYIAGIVVRYGQQYLDEMYELKRQAESGELPRLTKDEARQIAADHRRMALELKAAA